MKISGVDWVAKMDTMTAIYVGTCQDAAQNEQVKRNTQQASKQEGMTKHINQVSKVCIGKA